VASVTSAVQRGAEPEAEQAREDHALAVEAIGPIARRNIDECLAEEKDGAQYSGFEGRPLKLFSHRGEAHGKAGAAHRIGDHADAEEDELPPVRCVAAGCHGVSRACCLCCRASHVPDEAPSRRYNPRANDASGARALVPAAAWTAKPVRPKSGKFHGSRHYSPRLNSLFPNRSIVESGTPPHLPKYRRSKPAAAI
jgi:hypothetical protein